MTPTAIVAEDQQLLVSSRNGFIAINVRVHSPPKPRATVFCIHGFSGNARDFDVLATFLSANGYRVVCPDMVGRGGSAYLDDIRHYDIATHIDVLSAVANKYRAGKSHFIARGWGGAVALPFLSTNRKAVGRLILADVHPTWTLDADPSLQDARAIATSAFPTMEAALARLREGVEFGGKGDGPLPDVSHRLRQARDGYTPNFDPRILDNLGAVSGRLFDFGALLGGFKSPVLLMFAATLDDEHCRLLRAISSRKPDLAFYDGISSGKLIQFVAGNELLMTLGFLRTVAMV